MIRPTMCFATYVSSSRGRLRVGTSAIGIRYHEMFDIQSFTVFVIAQVVVIGVFVLQWC